MPAEPAILSQRERIQQAEGRIETHRVLIERWTKRRDEGDCVPDRETLTRWIEGAAKEQAWWEGELDRAQASPLPSII